MIGVIADPAEHDVVREFFELFKTPWEFYRERSSIRCCALCRRGPESTLPRNLVIVYAGRRTHI